MGKKGFSHIGRRIMCVFMEEKGMEKLARAITIYSAVRYWEAKAKSIKPVLRQNPEAIVKIAKEFNEFVEKGV